MHSPEKWTTCCITRKNIHDLKKTSSHAIWNLTFIANESKKRAHYIWKLCTHHFDRCQNCHLSFMHQMVFSVKFTSQMAYGDRSELFTYLKLCIILWSNIIFISRFKCVVHHFKLFAVEWRYSFAVEWRFTKPKSKKNYTFRECFYWIYGTTCTYGLLMKTFYFRGLNQVGLSNLVFIVLNNIDGLKVDFCTKRYY